jgi:hypothetical protein
MWKRQLIPKKYFLFIIAIIVIAYYFSEVKYILNIFISIIAASAFIYLLEQEWKLSLIKEISLFILILGIIFSGLTTLSRVAAFQPVQSQYNAVLFLQQQYDYISNDSISNYTNNYMDTDNNLSSMKSDRESAGYVLSYYKYGHLLQSIPESSSRKMPVLLDTNIYSNNKFNEFDGSNESAAADEIFYSRDIKKTTQMLLQYNIKYLFITPAMKSGIVWKKENQGLLFLLENSERFKRIYNNNSIEIWEFS